MGMSVDQTRQQYAACQIDEFCLRELALDVLDTSNGNDPPPLNRNSPIGDSSGGNRINYTGMKNQHNWIALKMTVETQNLRYVSTMIVLSKL